jgi:hypothetical protein
MAPAVHRESDQADRMMGKFKRHKAVAIAIIIGTFVTWMGSIFGALEKMISFFRPEVANHGQIDGLSMRDAAGKLRQEFAAATEGNEPPVPEKRFAVVDQLIGHIDRVDPGNGHALYYKGFRLRWRNQRDASHTFLYQYREQAQKPGVLSVDDKGEVKSCVESLSGYCKQRWAFIDQMLAVDLERAANRTTSRVEAVEFRRVALCLAKEALGIHPFTDPQQGSPTRVLVDRLQGDLLKAQRESEGSDTVISAAGC